jgi:hypothetical protein
MHGLQLGRAPIMLVSIQEAASFLQTHHLVFSELWRRREEQLTDSDLLAVIASTQPQATPPYLLLQLKRLRFIVEADEQGGAWELALPFRRWVEFLQMAARPVSSAVVRGRLQALEHLLEAFRLAQLRADIEEGRDVLHDARGEFQSLGEDLGQTRAAIASTVAEVKGEHRRLSAVERFRRINRLWNEYMLPMLELLDPSGQLEAVCSAWEVQLEHALAQRYLPDRRISDRMEMEMQLLRIAVRASFLECRRELEPLHARLRRDTLWTEGASRLLAQMERQGVLPIVALTTFSVSTFRMSGQISNAALVASAAQWGDFRATPPPIDFSAVPDVAAAESVERLLEDIERLPNDVFPIDDLLEWLQMSYSDHGFHPLLQVFSLLVTDARYVAAFSYPISEYTISGGIVRCGRVQLSVRNAA